MILLLLNVFPAASVAGPPPQVEVDRAVNRAAAYLARQILPSGQFQYRRNTNPEVVVPPKYNMLRHAGGIYALAQFEAQQAQPTHRRAMARAVEFLLGQVDDLEEVPGVQAVWSDPAISRGSDARRAKLGGTGLGLLALCHWQQLGGELALPQLIALGDFLLFMQQDDGGFYSIYRPGEVGRDDSWTSLYYPGEAVLGLLHLAQMDHDDEWLIGAREALGFLARERRGQQSVPADHWALIATAKLLDRDDLGSEEQLQLRAHAEQIVRSMLAEQRPQDGHATLDGCFTSDGRTTPTATRLEGLLAVLPCFADGALHGPMQDACHRGVRFLLRSQLHRPAFRGAIPRAIATLPEDHPGWTESFNDRSTEIRIDYVQHVLSALIVYRSLFYAEQPSR